MKTGILTILGVCVFISGYAQAPKLDYTEGSTVNYSVNIYVNPNIGDMKFLKAKQDKKDETIKSFNDAVNNGSVKPITSGRVFNVKMLPSKNPQVAYYKLSTNVNGMPIDAYTTVTADTFYISAGNGVQEMKKDTERFGFMIMGVQKIPMHLKTGTKLPSYESIGVLYPKTITSKVKENVFAGLQTKTTTEVGPYIDSYTGNVGNGLYEKTTTYPIYNTIETEVRKTLTVSNHVINYVNAEVTGTEPVTVNGKSYDAYVIESETWSKMNLNTTYESERESASNALANSESKAEDKIAKKFVKYGFTNPDGYMVTYKTEWFVPTLGVVKVRTYDAYGGISSDMAMTSVK